MIDFKKTSLFTVCTVNFISSGLVALKSAKKHNEFERFYLFVVDADETDITNIEAILKNNNFEWIRIFGPNDLEEKDKVVLLNAYFYYNKIEICCLAKYIGLSYVLKQTNWNKICIFIDADIYFYGSLNSCLDELNNNAVILTPHSLGPISDDLEHMYLMHGWINAGFIAFNGKHPKSVDILEWLINRISRRGYFAPEYGLSCDQTWLSLLPLIFNDVIFMSKHPGLNVAYWNLDERRVNKYDSGFWASDKPLVFFHFSGFEDISKGMLSKHSRIKIEKSSILYDICHVYDHELKITTCFKDYTFSNSFIFSQNSLRERMNIGFKYFGITNNFSTEMLGLFGILGKKIDSFFKKYFS